MVKVKINRKYYVDINNIDKIVIKDIPLVYKKEGYPKILKATEGLEILKLRLVNAGKTIFDFPVQQEDV